MIFRRWNTLMALLSFVLAFAAPSVMAAHSNQAYFVMEVECINPEQTELALGLWHAQRNRTIYLEHRFTGGDAEKLLAVYNAIPPRSSIVGDLILIFLERPGAPVLISVFKNNCRVVGFATPYLGYLWLIAQLESKK